MKKRQILKDPILVLLVLIVATIFGQALSGFGIRNENILMIYIVSAIIVVIESSSVYWGFLFSFLCTLSYNFYFVEPNHTFRIADKNSWFTIWIFFVVSILTSILFTQIKRQAQATKEKEEQMTSAFEITQGYLKQKSLESIVLFAMECIYTRKGQKSVVYLAQSNQNLSNPYYIAKNFEGKVKTDPIASWCLVNKTTCGAYTSFYEMMRWKYIPIMNESKVLGVLGVDCHDKDFDVDSDIVSQTILTQMTQSLERVNSYVDHRIFQIENARQEVYQELSNYVHDHILKSGSIHKLQVMDVILAYNADKLVAKKQEQSLADTVRKVADLYKKEQKNIRVISNGPCHFFFDRELIELMFCVLLDNFIEYTDKNCECNIEIKQSENTIKIKVQDDGKGYPEDVINNFDELNLDVYSGLSLCRIVTKVHHGSMSMQSAHGACTIFTFPYDPNPKKDRWVKTV